MATSLLSPLSSSTTGNLTVKNRFRQGTKLSLAPSAAHTRMSVPRRWRFKPPRCAKSFDYIPRQFRAENLKDGLMDNYKNAHQCLYGLPPSLLKMSITEDGPSGQKYGSFDEECLSSAYNLRPLGVPFAQAMSSRDMIGGPSFDFDSKDGSPPDLASFLLHCRIVYLGSPLVDEVANLILSQFLWLDSLESLEPIYLYLNCTGTEDENMQLLAEDSNSYAIASAMMSVRPKVYTVNIGRAYGHAGMLLSLGSKGCRYVTEESGTMLSLPRTYRSIGNTSDMCSKAKELELGSNFYVGLLARGIGKPREEIIEDIRLGKFFSPQEAVDYGIADRIFYPKIRYESNSLTDKQRKAIKAWEGIPSPFGSEW